MRPARLNVLIDKVVKDLPRDRSYLADQLQRAGTSIPLNIAEVAGEYSNNEKIRFYRIAKRSATECAAIFDLYQELKLIEEQYYRECRELLLRIVAMLIRMAQGFQTPTAGTHTGTHAGTKLVTP